MKNVLAIIQARMGSTRFPGKVLAEVNGDPLIVHCIRAAGVAGCDILVMLEDLRKDQPIWDACACVNANGYDKIEVGTRATVQRYDSLLRSYAAACENLDGTWAIVRICADSPMVTPERIRRAALAVQAGASYCGFLDGTKPHPLSKRGDACEAFSIGCLRHEAEVATDPECHQHVTWGMYMPSNNFGDERPYRRHWIRLPAEPRYPAIDTPENLETLKAMLSKEAELVGS